MHASTRSRSERDEWAASGLLCDDRPMTKHRALVTAPFRGPGLDTLRSFADVVLDPWIDHQPLRIYDADDAGRAGRRRRAPTCSSSRPTA